MRAKLVDGTVVILTKDCECITHDGPHWIYADELWARRNRELLEQGNITGFIHEELARLEEKQWHFEKYGIQELLNN